MTDGQLSIDQINALDRDEFVARLGFLFEHSPWIAELAWAARPFADCDELHRRLWAVVERAPLERRLDLIRAHPDLVGRAALAGTLGPASTTEQSAAGLDPDRLTAAEIAAFAELNRAYHARFGFPFVICARDNKKEGILAGLTTRLGNDRATEIATALAEIAKIAHYRLDEVVLPDR
jgi:OHCU decarboxylase